MELLSASFRQRFLNFSPILTVFFLFVYGGMDLAHSAGWNQTLNTTASQQFKCSWFIGVLGGSVLSSLLMSFLPKLPFYVSQIYRI